MPMVIVVTDDCSRELYREEVQPIHMTDEHSLTQIMDRLSWAVIDAHGASVGVEIAQPYTVVPPH